MYEDAAPAGAASFLGQNLLDHPTPVNCQGKE